MSSTKSILAGNLTAYEVLVVFFNIEHNDACDLNLLDQIEVTEDEEQNFLKALKNEENFAVLLKVWSHILLKDKQVVVVFHTLILPLIVLHLVIVAEFSVAEGKDIVSDLQYI